jgi:hypothetical protein
MPIGSHLVASGGGRWATFTNTTATATATTSGSGSYFNPFFGACGGSGTWTTNSTTDSWINATGWIAYEELDEPRNSQESHAQRVAEMINNRPAQMSAEQAQAEHERQVEQACVEHERRTERLAQEAMRRETANQRARELLLSKLSPEQRDCFNKNKWFVVEGGQTKKKYRIKSHGYIANIDVLGDNGKVMHRLCVHCAHDIPLEDHLLAQKIMLELAENDIVKLANRHAA